MHLKGEGSFHGGEVNSNALVSAIERLGVHDHLCLIYENREEQFAAAIPFMRIGLERGERCIYIADDNEAAAIIEAMRAGGIDVNLSMQSGALSVVTKQETYLKQGFFDPDWVINFLRQITDAAKLAGFSALRVTGEMTWVLGGDPGSDRLLEYESKLNNFFPHNDALAICQYNRKRFSAKTLHGVIETHPIVIYRNNVYPNFYYIPPAEFLDSVDSGKVVDRLLNNLANYQQMSNELRNTEELRRFNAILLDREMRILEVKHEVNELLSQLGQPPRYLSAESDGTIR